MTRSPAFGLIFLLALLACGSPRLFAADAIAINPEQAKLVGIETAPLGEQTGAAALRFPARVVLPPHQTRIVGAPLAGWVSRLEAEEEQQVRRGQILATIE